jgi:hypothetical protein
VNVTYRIGYVASGEEERECVNVEDVYIYIYMPLSLCVCMCLSLSLFLSVRRARVNGEGTLISSHEEAHAHRETSKA